MNCFGKLINQKKNQIPWRKTSLTEGRNLKTQKIHSFQRKTKVFQKI